MQNLRRSLQNKNSSGGLSPNRAPAALAPPRKVIKALYDYNSLQSEELSFTKGDFFHVVGNEDDEDWYEACNPVTGARGYVPVTYFQILEKSQRNSNHSEENGNDFGSHTDSSQGQIYQQPQQQQQQQQQQRQQQPQQSTTPTQKSKFQPLYGIVLYDFNAERHDELDAKVGDAILVIAKSNEEWYVAKHIGRLGGPGLIPVNFVEIRDMATGKRIDVQEMLRQTGTAIPRIEEWKKQALEYKANSIPLGKLEAGEAQQQQQQQQHHQHQSYHQQGVNPQQFMQQHQSNQNTGPTLQQLKNKMSRGDLKSQQREPNLRGHASQDFDSARRMTNRDEGNGMNTGTASSKGNSDSYDNHDLDVPRLLFASVESYFQEDDQYWFTVKVELSNGMTRTLYRLYEDFYEFHIALLEEFPVESGKVGDQPRILPFMPVPLQVVTDTITATRRADLDEYVKDLCDLPLRITQHPLVERLFALKEGDIEIPTNGTAGNGRTSPSIGRSTPSSNMFHSANPADRRLSPSAGPRAVFASKSQQGSGSYRGYPDDSVSTSTSPSLRSQSSFAGAPPLNGSSEEMIKLKISFQEDIMAMRIPVSITFRALQQKVFERIDTDNRELSYRDERGDFARLQNDSDVRDAIDRSGGKLMIYVD
ncbi:bud emergence protein 1 [Lobosporangium transversale]|uniref:SH3 domain-containing protein n=1 Tax=Lobosporangium transversale TaxID=64571 RepID=A0A1Y2GK40_9FUNG|nr:hypothetical protein BCR41DRAFT_357014 [Lobosporangium transversale]KAF9898711.1 bud emergence protein 1 [Lobosporangium transversale]ORZ11314.1 hypothetical protein BCR41DRAFT_357014 [Lobosporangium transversale]|eukprot:XP_021879629.1 hypothetical protein BCR41DRAFT_357014 [Lobosporangium transversale]